MAELRHYRYFVEIARRGSFTAAAQSLYVTQSSLSEQILNLERELGCRLLERGRHGARLTPEGEALLEMAEQLLRQVAEIERVARSNRLRPRQTLRIGVTMSPLLTWMPQAIAELRRRHESLEIFLEDAVTSDLFLRVSTGKLDLAIVSVAAGTEHGFASAGLTVEALIEDDWVALVAADHPLAGSASVALADLRNERLVEFPSNFSLRTVIDDLLRRAGISVRPVVETGWVEMAIRFVAAGVGISIVPRAVTLLQHPGVEVVEIAGPERWQRTMVALHREDTPRLALVEEVLDMARVHFEPLRGEGGWERAAAIALDWE